MYYLRELERNDIAEINRWRNNPKLIDFLGAPYRFINIDVDNKWFDNYMVNRNTTIRCSIIDGKDDKIIGLISLTDINWINQSATLHIMIGDKNNQNIGAGTFAVSKMLEHAFCNMNLQRIELEVLCDNERAIHLYEKVGFVKEGIKRNSVFKNGTFKDMLLYSILKKEFNPDKMAGK